MARIILTSDSTLMSEYNGNEFLGFAACSPALMPEWLYSRILCPPVKLNGNGALVANCGTRKVEAALLENGFDDDDVVVVRPQDLAEAVASDTKVIGITTNDPLGLGPASTTFSGLIGRRTYSALAFERLITDPAIRKNRAKVIVGGPGAWQIDERSRRRLGIDCVFIGEAEVTAPRLFDLAMNGNGLPKFAHGEVVPLERIPNIRNPTINGLVEIARGCGRGCRFCNPTMQQFRCRPLARILEEVRVNLQAGNGSVLLHAEDVLRYKARGAIPNPASVIKLFKEVKRLASVIGISHFALASALAKPKLIESLSEILEVGGWGNPWISGQTGIETGSPRLAKLHLRGKALPFRVENWPEVVRAAHDVLADNSWVPCSTLIFGMPGEGEGDVIRTTELIYELGRYKSLIVPLFFVPIGTLNREKFFKTKNMLPEHWQALAACMEHNFRWIYKISSEHFRIVRIPFWKRIAVMGILKVLEVGLKPHLKVMAEGKNPLGDGNEISPPNA